ncbi:MAG: winged helix-turn-helix transcriptional regulator [Thaumarchaeota archaeon]|nr:winged helix-turn-helix transcriptional regulator [Nitrososphaerota archaeon]
MGDVEEDGFDAARADLFEALGHPNRIRILEAVEVRPIGFAELKRQVGIDSSGHLTFHLGKLSGLVSLGSDGKYGITDDGKEALRMVRAARDWNEGGTHHGRPIEVRRILVVGAVVVIILLAAVAGIQQLRIAQLTTAPAGTVSLSGKSFWAASLPLSELPAGSNFTFIFHGVKFTFAPTLAGGGGTLGNITVTFKAANGTSIQSSVPVTVCLAPGNGGLQQGNAIVTYAFGAGVAYTVTFPDGTSEHSVLPQVSGCSSTASSGALQTTPWFSAHTNPQVALGEGGGMITMYVSA